VSKHRGANDNIVNAVAVNIGGAQRITKVSAQLDSSDIPDVRQIPSVENHLQERIKKIRWLRNFIQPEITRL